MHETADDLDALQRLLDASYRSAGAHLRSIFTEERRVSARRLTELLPGVEVLDLATVTATGEPRVAPVDGLFFRGAFYFGSSPDSVRFRHLRARPAVSASHARGETFAVIVHGTAQELDVRAPEHEGFRAYCRATYGDWWNDDWIAGSAYARIDATRMYTFRSPTA